MILLDANVLIGYVEPSDVHHGAATDLLLAHADEQFGASVLTLAEFLVGPARQGVLSAGLAAIEDIAVAAVPLGADAAGGLADLRARTGLRLPDCCVLHAAIQTGGVVATFDERLAASAAQLGIAVISDR